MDNHDVYDVLNVKQIAQNNDGGDKFLLMQIA